MDERLPSSRRALLRSVGGVAVLPVVGEFDRAFEATPATGWTYRADEGSYLAPLATGHNAVYAVTGESLVSISKDAGRTNWTVRGGQMFLQPGEVRPSTVLVRAREPRRLLAVEPVDGDIRWRAHDVRKPIVHDGTIYAFGDGLYALSESDGTVRWRFETVGEPRQQVPFRETTFIGTDDGVLQAVRIVDGTERWRYESESPFADRGVLPLAVRRGDGAGGGVDAETPRSPTLVVWDRTEFRVLALSAADGRVRWAHELEDSTPIFFPGTIDDQSVYVRDGRALVSIDLADGSVNWRVGLESNSEIREPMYTTREAVLGSTDDLAYAVSKVDGTLRWRFETDPRTGLFLSGVSTDGATVSTTDGSPQITYQLDASTGRLRWRFDCGCELFRVLPESDGMTYVGTGAGRLYALSGPGLTPLDRLGRATRRWGPPVLGTGVLGGASLVAARRLWRSPTAPGSGDRTDPHRADPALDDFDVRDRLSATAQTERYAATLPDRDDPVALVRLRPEARDDPELVAAFESGVETAADLALDGVPAVIASGTTPEPWLATELPDSGSLADRADDLPWVEGIDAVAAATEVVHAAHERGVTHGRLTPGSIRFVGDGSDRFEIWVMDWELRELSPATGPAADPGPDPYAAPEQVVEEWTAPPERIDVYRLGAVAYRAVTGRPPYGSAPDREAFETEPTRPIRPTDLDSGLPAKLDHRLLRALAVRPGDRHGSAREFADALRYGVPRE